MNKRKGSQQNPTRRSSRHRPSGFYTPFEHLDQHLTSNISNDFKYSTEAESTPEKIEPVIPDISAEDDDESLFQKAMAGVDRLPAQGKIPLKPPERKSPRFLAREELDAYTQLVDLVAGEGPFDLSSSDEYIDGAVLGISPEILKKLREGYFSYQDHLDLHGLNRQEAKSETTAFLMENFTAGKRCVLIIPGRGLNSRDKVPVLKNNLVTWLTRAPLKRVVLAFASARSCDRGRSAHSRAPPLQGLLLFRRRAKGRGRHSRRRRAS